VTARWGVSRRERNDAVETYHLLGYHDNRLDGEFPVAVVEEVLQARAEEVDDQNVVQAFLAEIIDIRDPGCTSLVTQLGCMHVLIHVDIQGGVGRDQQNKR
jgi:hypothetical protein